MIRRYSSAVAGCLLAAFLAMPAEANSVTNFSFETPLVPAGTFTSFAVGSAALTGWTVIGPAGTGVAIVSGSFTQFGTSFPAGDGSQWLDLTGDGSNTVEGVQQTVPTVAGTLYVLSFSVGNVSASIFGTTSTVEVLINGVGNGLFTNSAGATTQNWQRFSLSFVAQGDSTTIAFLNRDVGPDNHNGLDNVSLEPPVSPSVTTQPTSQSVTAGATATFTAAASGSPVPTVQWQVSTNGGSMWSDISGATSATYSFTAALGDSGNQYRAVFTNSSGTATSTAATLTVSGEPPVSPSVTTQPTSQSVTAGATATFTAAASGSPVPTVQWQVSTNGGSMWTDISGATSATYSFTAALGDSGNQYRAVFTNSSGTATSTAATLTVSGEPPVSPSVTTQPTSQSVTAGTTATFTAAASGSPAPTVRWQVSTNGSTWGDISGATSTTCSFTAALGDSGNKYRAVFTNSSGTTTTTAATLIVFGVRLNPTALRFGATKEGAGGALVSLTPPQTVTVSSVGPTASWTASADQPWVQVTSGSGTGAGRFTVSIVNPNNVLGASVNVTSTITVTSSVGQAILPVTLAVQLNTTSSAPPEAFFDTPVNGSTVTGAIGVTGWAVDDIGIANIKVYRNCLVGIDNPASCQIVKGNNLVFVGYAPFLAGARPDVEAVFPTYPLAYKAGWGMQVLTNMLPHIPRGTAAGGGQGTMNLWAHVTDLDGHSVLLGPKTITANNDHIDRPFGTIDTPALDSTVSGTVVNFGWALTPGPATIPPDGLTMNVVIDGVAVGKVAYNQCRGTVGNPVDPGRYCDDDIASLFGNTTPMPTFTPRTSNPSIYRNLDAGSGAIGASVINTQAMTNGLHTLAWGVIDDQNRNDGLGSRFFTVLNASGLTAEEQAAALTALREAPARVVGQAAEIAWRSTSPSEVLGRIGFNFDASLEVIAPDSAGVRYVTVSELGRLELAMGDGVTTGYLRVNGTLRPLPPGSQLDPATGAFTWAPGPGYIGTYDLVFLQAEAQVPLRVTIQPRTAAADGRMRGYLDLPAANATVSGAFTVAGWALDLDAWQGAGVGAVHVWAARRDVPAAAPVFLGAADLAGWRPDVAAQFGVQFDRTGWGLTASDLPPGVYDVTAYFWSTRTGRFEDARTVRVTVR